MKNVLLIFTFSVLQIANAQLKDLIVTPPYYIKTVKLDDGKQPVSSPIIQLGHRINFSFDDLQADEKEYSYNILRFDENWQPSILNESEYIDGFASNIITDITSSSGTLQSYTHYHLTLPNDDTRILLSGNYLLQVLDDDENVVFSKPFILYQKDLNVGVQVKWATDVQLKDRMQFIDFSLYVSGYTIQNESENLLVKIFQNNNINHSIDFRKPTFYKGAEWAYHYPHKALFEGLNEFRRFECKDVRGYNYGVSYKELTDKLYDFYTYTALPRTHYSYYKDIDGCYILNSVQAYDDVNSEAEFVKVHFTYQGDLNAGKSIYVIGRFNDFTADETSRLTLNDETGVYENVQLLKQGYYDYMFVTKNASGQMDQTAIEGSFAETENIYTVLVYYKAPGARYTKVIGYGEASSDNIR